MPGAYWGESFGSGLLSDPPNISARQTEIFVSNQTTDLKGYKRDFLRARRLLLRQVCHTYILSCTYPLLLDRLINTEVNISPYPGTEVPGLFSFARAVIFKSGVSCRNIGQEQLRLTHT